MAETWSGSQAMAVVVVTHQSAEHLPGLFSSILDQLREQDELVIVDNASTDDTVALAHSLGGVARVIETGANLGFAGGCHVGVQATSAPLILFLNPDCRPHPGCLERLREAGVEHPLWGAWQAVVMLDKDTINTDGGVVHYLGIGWAGDCGRAISELAQGDRTVAFPSGAAMVARRSSWSALGGLERDYFMYGEDLDLGLRLWLTGEQVGLARQALVTHDYEFDKGPAKWRWLERNRWRTILSVYPGALLVLLAPALLAGELGLLVIAAREGWLASKLAAQLAVLRGLPATLARRRRIQSGARISAAQFAAQLSSSLDSPYLGAAAGSRWLSVPQALYWRAVLGVLARMER